MDDRLASIMTYKTLWALCTVNKRTQQMKAVYYCACLVYGRAPLWGIWRVSDGRFLNFVAGKSQAEDQHQGLVWRRVMARWKLTDDANSQAADRRKVLEVEMDKPLPVYEDAQPANAAPGANERRVVH
jgi:hypothetical protein